MKLVKRLAASAIVVLGCAGVCVEAASVPSGYTDSTFVRQLASPTAMEFAPDGRLFVLEQTGAARVVKNGVLLSTPFTTFSVDSSGERGLLGIAFDPAFATNGFVYFYHTVPSPAHNRVTRLTANGDVALAGSAVTILDLENLGPTNHNGGALHFGADGKLYVAVGDNATGANSQSLSSRFGKVLRLNRDGSIPADNPFGSASSIWALGFRNPYTFAIRPGTGTLFINDVGESTYEEIDVGVAGGNYGWPTTEGPTNNPSFRTPLYSYQHGSGSPTGCAITGGAFWAGRYYFADFCGGWIYSIDPANPASATQLAAGASGPVDLKAGADGALYYLEQQSGSVRVIRPPPATDGDAPLPLSAWVALAALLFAVAVQKRFRNAAAP